MTDGLESVTTLTIGWRGPTSPPKNVPRLARRPESGTSLMDSRHVHGTACARWRTCFPALQSGPQRGRCDLYVLQKSAPPDPPCLANAAGHLQGRRLLLVIVIIDGEQDVVGRRGWGWGWMGKSSRELTRRGWLSTPVVDSTVLVATPAWHELVR